jgi:hypothetical protein
MIDTSPFRNINPGLYTVYWKSGGSSLAAVGVTQSGGRWLAPINWTSPTAPPEEPPWSEVLRMEPVDIRGPKTGGFSMFYALVRRGPEGDVSLSLPGHFNGVVVLVGGVPKVSVEYVPASAQYRVASYSEPPAELFAYESEAFERTKELLALREVCHDGSSR